MTAPSGPNRQPTTLPPGRRWSVEGSRTAACGQGAMGVIPADCLARWDARRSRFRRDVLQGRCAICPAAPVRTAAVPGLLARSLFFRRRLQLSCQQPSPRSWPSLSRNCASKVLPGAETFHVESRAAAPWLTEPSRVRSLKARGPSCLPARACRRSLSLFEAAALGRRRFAPPCRARSRAGDSSLAGHREHCDPCTQQMRCPWTRLDAEPSASWCHRVQA